MICSQEFTHPQILRQLPVDVVRQLGSILGDHFKRSQGGDGGGGNEDVLKEASTMQLYVLKSRWGNAFFSFSHVMMVVN